MSEDLFYILSLNHTHRRDKYVTIWRPDDCGYAYPTSWAGRYERHRVLARLGYYNSGHCALAVPCAVLDAIAVAPEPRMIDGDAGPVIPNTRATWNLILENLIAPPANVPMPEYRGAPRTKRARQ